MSDTTITPEERELWTSTANARINAVTPERLCEITAQERLVKALAALEAAEARVKARNKHIHTLMCEALENERNFDGMKSQWKTSEAEVVRLIKERDWLADKLETDVSCPRGDLDLECPFGTSPGSEACTNIIDAVPKGEASWTHCWKEAARKAAAGEGK